ncbi:MAG: hypothetical protein ACYDAR_03690 [Thermomicrobiales bacterium]
MRADRSSGHDREPEQPKPRDAAGGGHLNTYFLQHTRLLSYLVVLGEILMPIGVLFFLIVKFPASRFFLMAFMWLAIIWLVALVHGREHRQHRVPLDITLSRLYDLVVTKFVL